MKPHEMKKMERKETNPKQDAIAQKYCDRLGELMNDPNSKIGQLIKQMMDKHKDEVN